MWKIKTSQQYFFLHKYGNISLSKDWDVINFQECFDKWVDHRGIPPEKTIQKEVPLLTAKIVKKGFLLPFDEYITKSNYLQRNSRGSVSKGDLLLTTEAPVGNLAILDRNGLIGLGQRLLCLNTKKNDIQFYKFYLLSSFYQSLFQRLASGGVAQGITAKVLKDLPLICPPLAQQKSIASILSKQESIINNLEKVIDNKEKILKEFSHRLLSGEIRLKDDNGTISMYKNPDDNWKVEKVNSKDVKVPKDWSTLQISDKFDIKRGNVISKDYIAKNTGAYPVFSSATENNGEIGCINSYLFDGNYLTWTTDGIYAGTVFFREGKFNCTNVCGLLKNNDPTIYLRGAFYFVRKEFPKHVTHLANSKLMSNTVGNIKLALPQFSEQKLIADYLSKQEDSIENLKKLLKQEKKKFEFLLDNLLSGKYLVEKIEEEIK